MASNTSDIKYTISFEDSKGSIEKMSSKIEKFQKDAVKFSTNLGEVNKQTANSFIDLNKNIPITTRKAIKSAKKINHEISKAFEGRKKYKAGSSIKDISYKNALDEELSRKGKDIGSQPKLRHIIKANELSYKGVKKRKIPQVSTSSLDSDKSYFKDFENRKRIEDKITEIKARNNKSIDKLNSDYRRRQYENQLTRVRGYYKKAKESQARFQTFGDKNSGKNWMRRLDETVSYQTSVKNEIDKVNESSEETERRQKKINEYLDKSASKTKRVANQQGKVVSMKKRENSEHKKSVKNLSKQIHSLMRISFIFSSLRRGFNAIGKAIEGFTSLEQSILSSDAILNKYGASVQNIVEKMQGATGLSQTNIRGEFAKMTAQLQGQGFEGQSVVDSLDKMSNIALGIAGTRGMSVKESFQALENIVAGQPSALDRAGFQFDIRDIQHLDERTKTAVTLERMEKYLARAESSGIYLNNKTLSRQAELMKASLDNFMERIYRRFGGNLGEPLNLARTIFDSMFGGKNIESFNKSINDFLVTMRNASEMQSIKKASALLGEFISLIIALADKIVMLIGARAVWKLGKIFIALFQTLSTFRAEKIVPIIQKLRMNISATMFYLRTIQGTYPSIIAFFKSTKLFAILSKISLSKIVFITAGIIVILSLLVRGYKYMQKEHGYVFDAMNEFWDNMKSWIFGFIDKIKDFLTSIRDYGKNMLDKTKTFLKIDEDKVSDLEYARAFDTSGLLSRSDNSNRVVNQTNNYNITGNDKMGIANEIDRRNRDSGMLNEVINTGKARR